METNNLTPEKSFEIISQMIEDAKNRFEENGFIYVLWGVLLGIASFTHFYLIQLELHQYSGYPYFLMPLGVVITWVYMARKKHTGKNQIGRIVGDIWMFISVNLLILGFAFHSILDTNLIPVMLILIAIGMGLSGIALKSNIKIFAAIAINLLGFICFMINWMYHPLIMGIAAVLGILLPGVIFMFNNKKNQNV